MALFGIFGSKGSSEKKEKKELPWLRLTRMEQLDEIVEISKTKTVVIFKHSTRCGISSMALRQFESKYAIEPDTINLYYLDLLSFRDISDEVGIRFQVYHQSPQLIILRNGIAVHHASHHSIDANRLHQFI
ncbi:bacillithiol system redox-active protein YtxJ [Aureitalea sp. L0-47]|uniref:bacillithiol system redox-active protein YtxJ n=1 Tax=Aureitalea sp. L0-47 TaxID=2816962 RepID=UPI0022375646|nr:bacillithiol system redox-active protein YtxJ [Aureitalea sp. L0-47]MCW5519605.1 bacillithiol system redox-active protein YtxJ [Aureitalea sp. L0-47]